jgi:formylglycine-generating enzyme required for sulfatase activity
MKSGCLTLLFLAIFLLAQTHANDMVLIPAGPFQMGSADGEEDERPAHTVYLEAF